MPRPQGTLKAVTLPAVGNCSDPVLARAAAVTVVRTLRGAGHVAYFAGGCVRDELLGLHPTDYDVATDANPERVRKLFRRTNHVGAAFGVTLVHVETEGPSRAGPGSSGATSAGPRARAEGERPPLVTVEVATFRSDGPYADRRRPDSVVFADAPADAQRRDFTINALFLDPLAAPEPGVPVEGKILDLVGGVADLRAGIVRAVGDPAARLAEDHLRALRAVRFAARLGFTIEPGTATAIRTHAAELAGVSKERIGQELRRMLEHPARAGAAAMIERLGLDGPVLGDGAAAGAMMRPANALPTLTALGEARGLGAEVVFPCALAAWTLDRAAGSEGAIHAAPLLDEPTIVEAAARLHASLCLSNADSGAIREMLAMRATLLMQWPSLGVARQKRAAFNAAFPAAYALLHPNHPTVAVVVKTRLAEMAIPIPPFPAPEPLVTGDDLIGIGLVPGRAFKGLLDRLYDVQLEGGTLTKADALELARRLSV